MEQTTIDPPAPQRPSMLAKYIATWFGVGLLPKAPGTFGSIAALPFAWLLQEWGGMTALLIATLLLFLAGVWASETYMETHQKQHDPGEIVVDEVMGQWLLLVALPHTLQGYVLGLLLFRLFDIWKPWPIHVLDQQVLGGFGVMLDDFLAAVYPVLLWFAFALLCWMTGHVEWIETLFNLMGAPDVSGGP